MIIYHYFSFCLQSLNARSSAAELECPQQSSTLNPEPHICWDKQGARHVAKDIVGQGIANPMALMLSTSMLLRHLSLHSFSDR